MIFVEETSTKGLRRENAKHASNRKEELGSALHVSGEECGSNRSEPVEDHEAAVENVALSSIGDANSFEYTNKVVRNETVARPLTEAAKTNQNKDSLSVTRRGQEVLPTCFIADLSFNDISHLDELKVDKFVVLISITMPLHQQRLGFFTAAIRDEPSRRLRKKKDACDGKHSWGSLQKRWDSPRPFTRNAKGPKGHPSSEDSTDIPRGLIKGRYDLSFLGMGELTDEHGSVGVCEDETETDDEAGDEKHGD